MRVVPHGGQFAALNDRGDVIAVGHLEVMTSTEQLRAANGRRFSAPAMFVVDHINTFPGEPVEVQEGGEVRAE